MRTRIVIVAVVALIGAGCASRGASRPPFHRPSIQLQDVRMAGVGLTGGGMDVVLDVHNPNAYELHSPRVRYRLFVDDVQLATGNYVADIVVGPRDSARVRVPVSLSYAQLGQASRAVLNRGTLDYRVVGDITVRTPHGRRTSSYDRMGRFAPMAVMIPR